jgi:quercetin dioxygenase-like cupin family protein
MWHKRAPPPSCVAGHAVTSPAQAVEPSRSPPAERTPSARSGAHVATVTFAANGGSSGWHHHPGLVLVVVQSGEVTFYDKKCRPEVHKAGESFVETSDAPGLAKNHGAVDAVVQATFIVPSSTPPSPPTPLRIDDPQPKRCNVT